MEKTLKDIENRMNLTKAERESFKMRIQELQTQLD